MGKADIVTKQYMDDNQVFADAFNYLIYEGRQVIEPKALRKLDTVQVNAPYGAKQAVLPVQRIRDNFKYLAAKTDDRAAYLILGIENQLKVHYAMPVKSLLYDALEYSGQVREAAVSHRRAKDMREHSTGEFLSGFYKDDCLVPVITLVLSFCTEAWDGPLSLHDMIRIEDQDLLAMVNNYRIHLIDPMKLSEGQLDKFQSSLREVMGYIKYSRDRTALEKFVTENKRFADLDYKAAVVINECTNAGLKFDAERKIDMCKAIDDMRREAQEKGREQGREKGIEVVIEICKEMGLLRGDTRSRVVKSFSVTEETAEKYLRRYWG